MFVRLIAALLGLAIAIVPAAAREQVDLELVLLADSSGSIDQEEIELQRQGYVAAFRHREVLNAIRNGPSGRIAVTYVEWADATSQSVVVPWMVIDGAEAAERFATEITNKPRLSYGRNAIGAAIAAGQRLIETNEFEGLRRVIDFSGDSANNWSGISIEEARSAALAAGIVINGLAVSCREIGCSGRPGNYNLEQTYARTIIGGPGSFVVTVDGNTTFEDAVRRKLVLEISDLGDKLPAAKTTRHSALGLDGSSAQHWE